MICPRCEKELRTVKIQDTSIDTCDTCEGIWFDKDELGALIKNYSGSLQDSEIAAAWNGEIRTDENPGEKDLKCPRCSDIMRRYNYAYSSNVLIDGCGSRGCGVWIDDGEIKGIVEHLAEYKNNLSPEEKEELVQKVRAIKEEYELKENIFIDSMVKMDDQPGILRLPGEVLQFIYTMIYKIGL